MASKKGIVITGIILASITAASFLLWIVPQENNSTFIVTDYEGYLDGVKNIHEVLQESIDIEYRNLQDGKISPSEYIIITEVTSSQVTTQISEFVTSKPSEKWQESYISYMNGMKKFNEYIIETKVLANQIENESTDTEILETVNKIEAIKVESIEHIKKSNEFKTLVSRHNYTNENSWKSLKTEYVLSSTMSQRATRVEKDVSKSSVNKLVVICVDRDDDVGEKTGITTPVIGMRCMYRSSTKISIRRSRRCRF